MKVPAIEILKDAFDEFNEWTEVTSTPEDQHPSAMLLVVEPTRNPNARARITGDPDLLVQVLKMALNDPSNKEFARAFQEEFVEEAADHIEEVELKLVQVMRVFSELRRMATGTVLQCVNLAAIDRLIAQLPSMPDSVGRVPLCTVPPAGWRCTRGAGHQGPCAAVPSLTQEGGEQG